MNLLITTGFTNPQANQTFNSSTTRQPNEIDIFSKSNATDSFEFSKTITNPIEPTTSEVALNDKTKKDEKSNETSATVANLPRSEDSTGSESAVTLAFGSLTHAAVTSPITSSVPSVA